MTTVLAYKTPNGVVLAGDTRYSSYTEAVEIPSKIFHYRNCAIGFSGDMPSFTSHKQVLKDLAASQTIEDLEVVLKNIRSKRTHWLVVWQGRIFGVEGKVNIWEAKHYHVIGSGSQYAQGILAYSSRINLIRLFQAVSMHDPGTSTSHQRIYLRNKK